MEVGDEYIETLSNLREARFGKVKVGAPPLPRGAVQFLESIVVDPSGEFSDCDQQFAWATLICFLQSVPSAAVQLLGHTSITGIRDEAGKFKAPKWFLIEFEDFTMLSWLKRYQELMEGTNRNHLLPTPNHDFTA